MKKLTVLFKRVGEAPEVVTVENTLEQIQSLVGGYIEPVQITKDIYLIVNEEGKLANLDANFSLLVSDYLVDVIYGNAFFVASLGEDFHSLDKLQLQEVRGMYSKDKLRFTIKQ